ncbi:MAG: MerR family transcriptional regulator [Candidatus Puniceispirillaceae bacterium]|jgi:DNA-binding transcriptional MerR regulator
MTDKSSDAFRTISEVSAALDVPPHVLRFWETKFTSLRPLKRSGGRRYYRPDDVAVLTRIRDLLYKDGFTIKGAQRFLKSKEALAPTGVVADSATGGDASDLAAIQAILDSARKRLASVKSQLHP